MCVCVSDPSSTDRIPKRYGSHKKHLGPIYLSKKTYEFSEFFAAIGSLWISHLILPFICQIHIQRHCQTGELACKYEHPWLLLMKVKVNNLSFLCCSLWGAVNVVIFNTIVFLITMSHLRAVLSDPGVVPLPSASMDFSDLHSSQPPKNTTVSMFCESASLVG